MKSEATKKQMQRKNNVNGYRNNKEKKMCCFSQFRLSTITLLNNKITYIIFLSVDVQKESYYTYDMIVSGRNIITDPKYTYKDG